MNIGVLVNSVNKDRSFEALCCDITFCSNLSLDNTSQYVALYADRICNANKMKGGMKRRKKIEIIYKKENIR